MNITMGASGADRFDALARRFARAGSGGLQGRLTGTVRADGATVLAAVRAAWMGVEVTSTRGGGSSSGLRARVAAATSATPIPDGVRVEVEASAVDPVYGGSLTRGLNGMGRWRHPVFGDPDTWTQQAGQEVFYSTLRRFEPSWRAGLERVVDQTAREIEG